MTNINLAISRIIRVCFTQPLYRQTRAMTLGTRTIISTSQNSVMLIYHSYAKGWALPGGGVERGETIVQSAIREIREEAAIIALSPPLLRGICLNDRQFPGDHVAILHLDHFNQETFHPTLEIRAASFFPLDQLPEDTTAGTRRHLSEFVNRQPVAAEW